MTESFAELFEQSQIALVKLKPGAIVTGIVVEIRSDVVVINAGLKSEGIVPIEQFRNEAGELEVDVGDTVKVALESLENGFGETVLSREKAKRAMVWDELETSMEAGEIVTGRISGKVKGGFTVDIRDVRAFLPGSLVDVRPVRDPGYLEGKELEFKIIKLDRKRNNVVVSRRAVVESEISVEREQLLERLQEGAIVKGVVKNLTDYGAFVDLGGIDGLLHITDMAWKRVRHPSEVVNVGEELRGARAQVRPRAQPRLAGPEAARRRSVGQHRASLPDRRRACSARSPTSPITARSSRSSRAWKAWCTCPRWTGPTRTSTRRRSSSWATTSR